MKPSPVEVLDIEAFLLRKASAVLCDVRTPAEYARGHIPGASGLPLFSDEERAEVGTAYKRLGREGAMLRSLDLVGPRSRSIVETARDMGGKDFLLYCWRGGMRSAGVAELLAFFGFRVSVLRGGYKAFRHFAFNVFTSSLKICIVGGKTGSGKTELLHALSREGEQIVDLEHLATHRGSAFGGIGRPPQPSQEHFENLLAESLRSLDHSRRVWVEDESRLIGQCQIPGPLWEQMRQSPVYFLDLPEPVRLDHVISGYRDSPVAEVSAAIGRIQRRLGGEQALQAQNAVAEGNVTAAARILLGYYDRSYLYALSRRPSDLIVRIETDAIDAENNARRLINLANRTDFNR